MVPEGLDESSMSLNLEAESRAAGARAEGGELLVEFEGTGFREVAKTSAELAEESAAAVAKATSVIWQIGLVRRRPRRAFMQVGTIRMRFREPSEKHDSGAGPVTPARGGVVGTTSVPSQPLGPAQTRLRRAPITQPHP
jgi:hypothetical protein